MTEKSFTFIEIIFVKTLITFKNKIKTQEILSCVLFLLVGFIFSTAASTIVEKILEIIIGVDKNYYKSLCKRVKFNGQYFYIPVGKNTFIMSHSRIILIARLVKFIIMAIAIHGCTLAFIESIGGLSISAFGFVLVAAHAIKSSLGAGIWILANGEIQRGNIIYFNNDKRVFLMIKNIGWMKTTCNDVSDVIKNISHGDDLEKSLSMSSTQQQQHTWGAKQMSIPNTQFLSGRIGFFWFCNFPSLKGKYGNPSFL